LPQRRLAERRERREIYRERDREDHRVVRDRDLADEARDRRNRNAGRQPLRSSGRFVASTTEAIVYSNGRGRLREEADFSVGTPTTGAT
jgi:hypothetical protein